MSAEKKKVLLCFSSSFTGRGSDAYSPLDEALAHLYCVCDLTRFLLYIKAIGEIDYEMLQSPKIPQTSLRLQKTSTTLFRST